MVSFAGALLLLVMTYPGYLLAKQFFKRTQGFWIKLMFPVGYALYKTKLGYGLHLRKLKQERSRPHSITSSTALSMVTVLPVAVLDDNYSYLVIDTVTNTAVAVDPCDPSAVMKAAVDNNVSLKAILTTHRHWDHAGGNELLKKRFPDIPVYGGALDKVAGVTHEVQDKDIIKIGRLGFEAISTPGHTVGHMTYRLQNEPPCVFSGDHIFICGNGQMFEGTPEVMLSSIKKVMSLPRNSLIFPGHEYSLKNLRFALKLLPASKPVQMKWQWVKQQRERELSTVPSILSEELQYNPFMLTEERSLKEALGLPPATQPAQVLAELRRQKNLFDKNALGT